MLVLSHRGFHTGTAENTLEAFEAAIALGVDGIETDVRCSADGELVLYHNRCAPDGRAIDQLSRNELSDQVGYAVPDLQVALQRWDSVLWNLDIKDLAAMDAVVDVLGRFTKSHELLVTSLWHSALVEVSRHNKFDCGLIVHHCPLDFSLGPSQNDAARSNIDALIWNYDFLDPELFARASTYVNRTFVWNVGTQSEIDRCAELGIAGVILDHPERFLR